MVNHEIRIRISDSDQDGQLDARVALVDLNRANDPADDTVVLELPWAVQIPVKPVGAIAAAIVGALGRLFR
jgi:hypothetical protein